jgi:hypothetical protein
VGAIDLNVAEDLFPDGDPEAGQVAEDVVHQVGLIIV